MRRYFTEDFYLNKHSLSETFRRNRYLLTEADKSRFINPIWDELEYDPESVMIYIDQTEDKFPNRNDIIKWVNSGAANKYKIDWQKFDPKRDNWTPESVATDIIKPYLDYTAEKSLKNDPKTSFQNKDDFEILFENKDFLFVGVKTYNGAKFCDSFKCGGAGAEWCIGYKRTDNYWLHYNFVENKRFVLAYNKTLFGDENKQKYMLEIYEDGRCKAWPQSDEVKDTMKTDKVCEFFSLTNQDISNFYSKVYNSVKTPKISGFSIRETLESEQNVVIDDTVETVNATDLDCDSFYYGHLCILVKFGKNTRKIRVDGEGEELYLDNFALGSRTPSESSYMEKSLVTEFIVTNFSKVVIRDLYVTKNSPKLNFVNCGSVEVDTIHFPYGFEPEEDNLLNIYSLLNEYNDYARGIEAENLQIDSIRFNSNSEFCEFVRKPGVGYIARLGLKNIAKGRIDTELLAGYTRYFIDFDGDEEFFKNDTVDLSKFVTSVPERFTCCLNVPFGCEVIYSKHPEADIRVRYCI